MTPQGIPPSKPKGRAPVRRLQIKTVDEIEERLIELFLRATLGLAQP